MEQQEQEEVVAPNPSAPVIHLTEVEEVAPTPLEALPAAPSLLATVASALGQQIREELGVTRSTESKENVEVSQDLERLRVDTLQQEAALLEMTTSYEVLREAIRGFGEHLYELAIKEEEKALAAPLMESGLMARSVSQQLKDVKVGLDAYSSSLQQQHKAIQDSRDTRESVRLARLAHDAAERVNAPGEAGKLERERALAKYNDLAEALKTKVMLLHQYRIRVLKKQLVDLRALFFAVWSQAQAKIPSSVPSASSTAEQHTKAISELLTE